MGSCGLLFVVASLHHVRLVSTVRPASTLTEAAAQHPAPKESPCNAASRYEFQFTAEPRFEKYFVSSDACKMEEKDAQITAWLDKMNPIQNSTIHAFLAPQLVDRIEHHGLRACLCGQAGDVRESACAMEMQPARSRILQQLRWLFLQDSQADKYVIDLQDSCPIFVMDGLVVLICAITVLLLAGIVASLHAMLHMSRADHEVSEGYHLESVLVVPSVTDDFKTGTMQVIRLTTLMMSLQSVVLECIKKQAGDFLVGLVILWPCAFGVVGIMRTLRTMCQQQLANAALCHGISLEHASAPRTEDAVVLAGTAVLVVCTAIALAALGFVKLFLLLVTSFAGPALSIFGELQKAKLQDEAMQQMEGKHRMRGLLQVFSRRAKDSEGLQPAGPSVTLSEGTLAIVSLSRLLDAGRSGRPVLAALQAAPGADVTNQAASLRLWRDLPWQGRALFELTGSRLGLLTFPLLISAVFVLLAASVGHTALYLCSASKLDSLTLASHHNPIDFAPWVTKYDIELDRSIKEVMIVATAKASNTKSVAIDQRAVVQEEEEADAAMKMVQLMRPLPQHAQVLVQGLRTSTASYDVQFSPVATFPISVRIMSEGFDRCVRWSELPGSIISVPSMRQPYNFSVLLSDYKQGIPYPCHTQPTLNCAKPFTTFCDLKHGMSKLSETCRRNCRHDPDCLAAFAGDNGCFRAMLPSSTCDASHTMRPTREPLSRNVSGKLCLEGVDPECWQASIEGWTLKMSGVKPEWLNRVATFKLDLGLAVGEQMLSSDLESLRISAGPAQPLEVLVNLTGELFNGAFVQLQANATSSRSGVVVTIAEYHPNELGSLLLSMVVLLPDSDYDVEWATEADVFGEWSDWVQVKNVLSNISFSQCAQNFLQGRYKVCNPEGRGWDAPNVSISLPPFAPQAVRSLDFKIVPRNRTSGFAVGSAQQVQIQLHGTQHASVWALGPEVSSDRCRLLQHDLAAENETWHHVRELWNADVACQLLARGCNVAYTGVRVPVIGTFNLTRENLPLSVDYSEKDGRTRWDHQVALRSVMGQLLRCALKARADERPSWALASTWQECSKAETRELELQSGLQDTADLLCLGVRTNSAETQKATVAFHFRTVLASFDGRLTGGEEVFLQTACRRVLKVKCPILQKLLAGGVVPPKEERPRTIEEIRKVARLVDAGVRTGSLHAVNVTFEHCLPDDSNLSLMSNRDVTLKSHVVGRRAWMSFAGAEVLGSVWDVLLQHENGLALIHSLLEASPKFGNLMLPLAVNKGCHQCWEAIQQNGIERPMAIQVLLLPGGGSTMGRSMRLVLPALQSWAFPKLTDIQLGISCGTDKETGAWLRMLRKAPRLRAITLDCQLGPQAAAALADLLGNLTGLQELHVPGSADELLPGIVNASRSRVLSSLTSLRLGFQTLNGSDDMGSFGQALSKIPALQTLDLGVRGLAATQLHDFALALQSQAELSKLESFFLSTVSDSQHSESAAESDASPVVSILAKMPSLRRLHLRLDSMSFPAADLALVASKLLHTAMLEELQLAGFSLNKQAMKTLVDLVKGLPNFAELRIQNAVDDAISFFGTSVAALNHALPLRRLSISNGNISNNAIEALGEAMRNMPGLEAVDIESLKYDDTGVVKFWKWDGPPQLTNVKILRMSCCQNLSTLQLVMEKLQNMPLLEEVQFDGGYEWSQDMIQLVKEELSLSKWKHMMNFCVHTHAGTNCLT